MKSILRSTLILIAVAWALPNVQIASPIALILASLLYAVLFNVLRPILKLLFLPLTIVTFGIFSFVIQAGLLWLLTYVVPGFVILPMIVFGVGFTYFWTIAILAVLMQFLDSLLKKFI